MTKYPSEIFGYYWKNQNRLAEDARQRHFCPFSDTVCFKQSRLIKIPFGVCTAHVNGNEIALCPRRFLDSNIVFRDIALKEFNTLDNILVFSEVGLKGIGNFDFVMVKHKPISSKIDDFTVIEFQTGQTTSTGELVEGFKDFINNRKFSRDNYGFGINNYDIWKRTFTQILNKGIILEKWRRKIYWVVQQPIFDYFHHKYRLGNFSFNKDHSTVFALYDLCLSESDLILSQTRMLSSSVDALFDAFRRNDDIPPVEKFIERLQMKVNSDIKLGIKLDIIPERK
jgi:hypothetical protein